jgi:hypothetical protein
MTMTTTSTEVRDYVRLTLVEGDLFDSGADILVVPCSTGGTASAQIRKGLSRLGVE